jgi:hypothetical protein
MLVKQIAAKSCGEGTDAIPVEQPRGQHIRQAAQFVVDSLTPTIGREDAWNWTAGTLTWSCRATAAHVVDCLNWYAALLARHATTPVEVSEIDRQAQLPVLFDSMFSAAAVLAAAVTAAAASDRAWHSFGVADRSAFAGMGCDEVLVHGYDLAKGLGVAYEPPADLCEVVLRRLFPWTPDHVDPWVGLLWANGRSALGDRQPETQWLWLCSPLSEWDGEIRRRPPKQ